MKSYLKVFVIDELQYSLEHPLTLCLEENIHSFGVQKEPMGKLQMGTLPGQFKSDFLVNYLLHTRRFLSGLLSVYCPFYEYDLNYPLHWIFFHISYDQMLIIWNILVYGDMRCCICLSKLLYFLQLYFLQSLTIFIIQLIIEKNALILMQSWKKCSCCNLFIQIQINSMSNWIFCTRMQWPQCSCNTIIALQQMHVKWSNFFVTLCSA